MRIVYVIKYIAQLGGLDRVMTFKMNWMASHGHEVHLITYEQEGHGFTFPLDTRIKHRDIGVKMWKKQGNSLPRRLISYFTLRRLFRQRMTEAISDIDPDVLVTLTDSYSVLDILQNIPTRAVRIIESHVERRAFMKAGDFKGRWFMRQIARIYDWHLSRHIRNCDALVVLTNQDAAQWPEVKNVKVIPNPLTNWPKETGVGENHLVVAAGRLEPQKGFDLLVNAWQKVHKEAPDWQLAIYGDGNDHDAIQYQIDEYGLSSCITLYPATPDIFKFYLESSIFVLSSRYEGYGLVLAEAMSCGIPCVSFDCPFGPSVIIRDREDGLLVTNGDTEALAAGILHYIKNPEARKAAGQSARNNIQRFAPESIMQKWEDVFTQKCRTRTLLYIIGGIHQANGMSDVMTRKVNWLARNTDAELHVVLTERPDLQPFYKLDSRVKVVNFGLDFDRLDTLPLWRKLFLYKRLTRKYKRLLTDYLMMVRADIVVSALRRDINFLTDINDGSRKIGELHFSRASYRVFNRPQLPKFINLFVTRLWQNSLIKKLNHLKAFVVLSNEDADAWKSNRHDANKLKNIKIIPNSIKSLPTITTKLTNKRVIAAGRYTEQKGFDLLLRAWQIVEQQHPDWSLSIFGSGDNSLYYKLAQDLGLSHATCNGLAPDLNDEMQNSSIFVLSSRYEGFGLVVAEAQALGLPVVSFACPCGPRDIITNNIDGLLIEPAKKLDYMYNAFADSKYDDVHIHSLADALCKLISDDELRSFMSIIARQSAQRFSESTIMQKWQELFGLSQ